MSLNIFNLLVYLIRRGVFFNDLLVFYILYILCFWIIEFIIQAI